MSARATISKARGTMSLFVEGEEVPLTSGRFVRSMATAVDAMTATVPYQRGQSRALDTAFKPYSYAEANLYLGPDLVMQGTLYKMSYSFSGSGSVYGVEVFSATADIMDSTMTAPYEYNNMKLSQLAKKVLEPFEIEAVFESDEGAAFERIAAKDASQSVLELLVQLAKQRGLLISTDKKGRFIFRAALTSGNPVATFVEGLPGLQSLSADHDGRKRFGTYNCYATEAFTTSKGTSMDSQVPARRVMNFNADESTGGNVKTSAKFRRNRTIAETVGLSLPVVDWYDEAGELWAENTIVAVQAPSLYIDTAYQFLVRGVEFEYSASGRTAVLDLVPPEVYSGEEVTEPWA